MDIKLKHWVELGRIHTSALTSSILVIGYILAGNSLFSFKSLIWWLWGVLFHYSGFLNNNLMDYKYDKADPHKQHFPLIRGIIKYEDAVQLDCVLLTLLGMTGVLLSNMNLIALFFLVLCILTGFIYNYISKISLWAPLPISICFGFLIAFPYFAEGGNINTFIIVVLGFWFFTLIYQIAYSGYYKDMESDKINLLKKFGAKVKDSSFIPSYKSIVFAIIITVIKFIFLILILFIYTWNNLNILNILISILIFHIAYYYVYQQIKVHPFKHDKVTRLCALVEILTFYSFSFAVLNIVEAIIIIIIATSWFIGMNYYYWRSREFLIGPKV